MLKINNNIFIVVKYATLTILEILIRMKNLIYIYKLKLNINLKNNNYNII